MSSRAAVLAASLGWLVACGAAATGCSDLPPLPADGGRHDGGAAGGGGASDAGGTGRGGQSGGGGAAGGRGGATAGSGGASAGSGGASAGSGGAPAGSGGATAGAGGASGGSGGRGGGTAGTGGSGGAGATAGSGGGSGGVGGRGGSGGGGRGGGTAGTSGGLAPNGTACTFAGACLSGFCVDGRCCNTACSGQCEACDVPSLEGICAPVPPGPPHGTRTPCMGSGVCAGQCGGSVRTACTYPSTATSCRAQSCANSTLTRAASCGGLGSCAAPVMMTCAQGCAATDCLGACTADAQCAAAGQGRDYCDAGTCTERLPNGRTCSAGTACTSGRCVDGYCCNSDCADQCSSCKEPGSLGTCVTVVGTPRAGGTPVRSACAGTGVCQGQCDGVSTSCRFPTASTACGNASCSGGILTPVGGCNGSGACEQTPNTCTTGYCSTATTCGSCPSGDTCGAGQWCFEGTCGPKRGNGQSCTADGACTSNHCVSDGQSGRLCCPTACSGNSVCYQGSCCTVNTACDTSCRAQTCQRGCGLPDIPRNCGCTSTSCCGNVCCSGQCSNGVCSSPPASCT